MRKFIIANFLALAVLSVSCENDTIVIVDDGMPIHEIVVEGDTSTAAYTAATILQSYLEKIGNSSLDIVQKDSQHIDRQKIFIGNFLEKPLNSHAIAIKTVGKDIYISGGSEKSLTYATYEFLERFLDCNWYAPDVESVPSSKTIAITPIDYSYAPEITTRTVHSRLFYENSEFADKHKVTYEAFPHYVPKARVHTFHRFLPEEDFYEEHPEYYALRGDKRLPTQLCLTNDKVFEIVKDSVRALFQRFPNASVVSVSQDDNQQYCQCNNCSAIDEDEGAPSGTMIRFVNQVARSFPDKTISTLAYQHTRKPPKTRPEKNVLITLCSIECDRSAPIAEKCKDFADDLKGWSALTDNIRIWDYTTQFTNFLAPFPNLGTLKPNIQLFKDNNAKWVFAQHSHNPSELFELRSYVMAKLLWNPNLEMDRLLTDFTDGYYQEAGVYIKEYIDLIHDNLAVDTDFFLFLYGDPSEAFSSYLSPEWLEKYSELFDKAEKAVTDKLEILNRVKKARLGIDYAILEASRKGISPSYRLIVKDSDESEIINPLIAVTLDDFMETTENNNIVLMNEMGFTVSEYGSNYLSALETAQKPNKARGKEVVTITRPKKYANEDPMALTDGALGGSSFYSNWLGYEGNDMEVVIDLGEAMPISSISMAFLQVTNHIVFLPKSVTYYGSLDNKKFDRISMINNPYPLQKTSKVNRIAYFDAHFDPVKARFVKVKAKNMETPYWHHAAGLPSWIFADEIIID